VFSSACALTKAKDNTVIARIEPNCKKTPVDSLTVSLALSVIVI
jgi:hypothetical protein